MSAATSLLILSVCRAAELTAAEARRKYEAAKLAADEAERARLAAEGLSQEAQARECSTMLLQCLLICLLRMRDASVTYVWPMMLTERQSLVRLAACCSCVNCLAQNTCILSSTLHLSGMLTPS